MVNPNPVQRQLNLRALNNDFVKHVTKQFFLKHLGEVIKETAVEFEEDKAIFVVTDLVAGYYMVMIKNTVSDVITRNCLVYDERKQL